MENEIIVIGSSNTDMVLKTPLFPKPGETILGGEFYTFQGGKGANQAVAAARAGGNVRFICRVGNDAFGNSAIRHYTEEGIDTAGIFKDDIAPTGVAVIAVNGEGENSITVASGANALLSVPNVSKTLENLSEVNWLITQLETPIEVVVFLASYARENRKHLILNPAPAASLPNEVYTDLFLITPNETETELLTGIEVTDEASAKQASEIFKVKGVKNVIITMGSKGAFISSQTYTGMIETKKVKAIDTTAAGDVFNGALVVALSEGKDWKEAILFANNAAAISVTKMGAQSSAPYKSEIDLK